VLNYCYGILYGRIEKACILSGLDPYVGFLHTDNYNKKSLVFDLIEPFRIYAEQAAVYLFTGKQIRDDYFGMSENAVSLNITGKPVVIEAMNKHLEEAIRYKGKNVKRKYILKHTQNLFKSTQFLFKSTQPFRESIPQDFLNF